MSASWRQIDRFDPDLVLGVETDDWWAARLASMLPGHRHHVLHPLDNTYGMVLFSRLELVGPEVRFLLKDDIPSIRTDVRLASGDLVRLYCLHPEPPSPTEAPTSLPRDAELVLIGREIAERPGVVIVARRPQRCRLVAHQPAVPPPLGTDRPTHRPRLHQHLRRPAAARPLAARPRVLRPRARAAPAVPSAGLRLRSFPDLHRARLSPE